VQALTLRFLVCGQGGENRISVTPCVVGAFKHENDGCIASYLLARSEQHSCRRLVYGFAAEIHGSDNRCVDFASP